MSVRRARLGDRSGLVLVVLACTCVPSWAASAADGSYEAWVQHRDAILKDPSLVRYYGFEDARDGSTPIANLVAKEGALSFGVVPVPGQPNEQLTVIEGRWPRKKAVRLDSGFLYAPPFEVANRSFTVEAWLRTNGLGSLHGDSVPTGGTLLSLGGGYWDGWRLTMLYPDNLIGFEIGRPQPSSSVGIRTGSVADGVWHHLAATWDGKRMCVYVDGFLAGAGDYVGDFTPPAPGMQFRVGFAGYGWGSAKLDVDEVAIYRRALSATEVLQSAFFQAPMSNALAARFAAADQAYQKPDYAVAASAYREIARLADAEATLRAIARLRLGQVLMHQKDFGAAMAEFAVLIDSRDLPDRVRGMAIGPIQQSAQRTDDAPLAAYEALLKHADLLTPSDLLQLRLSLARRYRREKDPAAALAQYKEVLKMEQVSGRAKLDIQLQMAHAACEGGDHATARAEYARIIETPDAPPQYRTYAQLCIGQTCVRQKDYDGARAAYEKVLKLEGAPEHYRWEAEDCLREVERLKAGLPRRDPAWSRMKLPARSAAGAEFWVAADGADGHPGTRQHPFASLRGARDAIRALRRTNGLPEGGVVVTVQPGGYRVTETLKLEAGDSGTEASPIVYRAEVAAKARFTGGVRISGFAPVTDAAILARLPEESRGKMLQTDLGAQGIIDFGELRPRGFGFNPPAAAEVFFDGRPLQPGRWPNEGYVQTGKVLDAGGGAQGAAFQYSGDRPARWTQARDPWVFGFWRFLWADASLGVAGIDTQARQLKLAHPYGYGGGVAEDMPYYAYNLLEEIDQPGECYLDRTTGILYVYPPSDPAKATVEFSLLATPFVQMDEVSHVTLEGLLFELGRTNAVVINGGDHCLVAGCVIRKLAGDGIVIEGGSNHGVLSCDLYTLGRGGTRVKGGDRRTLTAGGQFVENCHVHHFSRLDRTYTPAVLMDGCGNRIAHNLFHDSPCHAIRLEGNDHVVELNEIHSVLQESDDQGGLDMFFNPTYRGDILRYNFWHDIGNGLTPCGQAGIRLDDAISGVIVYGNVFWRCSHANFGGLQIHGGKENEVDNNVFADCDYGISFSGWGPERWKAFLASEAVVKATTEDVDIRKPLYSTRYPALAHLEESPDVNMVWRNLAYHCGAFLTRDRGIQDLMDNRVSSQDPGLAEAEPRERLRRLAAVIGEPAGFRPIPWKEIGLYEDRLRTSLPVEGK